jgi:hypothetical protein
MKNILRCLFLGYPVTTDKKLVFTSFNFHEILKKVKNMIINGSTPVDASFHPDYLAINYFMTGSFFSKVLKIRQK